MAVKRVRMTFPENLIQEPIIYQLGREFAVVTNVRMADVDEHTGWVVLELDGAPQEIDLAVLPPQEIDGVAAVIVREVLLRLCGQHGVCIPFRYSCQAFCPRKRRPSCRAAAESATDR